MPLQWVLGDFETASATDLKKAGAWRYAECPTTEIFVFGYTVMGESKKFWHPGDDPTELMTLAADDSVTFIAHNAGFEKAIWRKIMVPVYGFPDIPNSRWHDAMAVCAMKGLPQDLDRVTMVLRLPHTKDKLGSNFTKNLSKPNKKTGMLDRSPEARRRVDEYNGQDLDAEVGVHARVGWLPPGERSVWLLDQRINERGVRLDLDYISACREIVYRASVPLQREFTEITGLEVTQAVKLKQWVLDQGVQVPDMKKETLDALLGNSDDEDSGSDGNEADDQQGDPDSVNPTVELPEGVRRALGIRQLIGSASIKKLARMEGCVLSDGRAYGLLQYHGAGPGRWAGRLFQPHNFPRGTLKENIGGDKEQSIPVETVVEALMSRDPEYVEFMLGKPPVECVVSGLRHSIISNPNRILCAGDFSTIELRVLLALAGQTDKVDLIASGQDPYCDMATLIFGYTVVKAMLHERQYGKNSVLGLGFGMGGPKFQFKYAKDMPIERCKEIVGIYRETWAPAVPKLWYGLEKAALTAVWEKRPTEAYGVEYRLEDGWLSARLPSGRKLWYWNPQPVKRPMPWDDTDIRRAWTYQAMKMGQLKTIDAYGGHLCENVVQALARDIMVAAMFKAERNGFPVILTVHDELLTEPERGSADEKALDQIMCDRPEWAKALSIPIKTETWVGERYRK